ncbi:MAG: DUF202 domain-containing protein [Candidatus Baltobacteraceae bacterium]
MTEPGAQRQIDTATRLAFDRTWLAQERTLLSWVRTATSLIGFGFAVFSFFGPTGPGRSLANEGAAELFAVSLISIGLFALVAAAVQRRRAVLALKSIDPDMVVPSMSGVVGILVACVGLFALVMVMLRR